VKKKRKTARCRDARASTFVVNIQAEIFAHFHAKVTVECGTDCLALQGEFIVNNLLDVKENYDMVLTLLLICLAFSFSVSSDFQRAAHVFFPKCLSNHCQGLRCTFSEIYTQFDVPLSDN
jgi:hypothetical protein